MITPREIIEQLESDSNQEEAFFAFCHEEERQDNEHLKANKDGILRFASYLLRIVYDIDSKPSEHDESIHPISQSFLLPNEGMRVLYLKFINKNKSEYSEPIDEKETWIDKLFAFSCLTVLLVFVACGFIGIYNVIRWIF